MGALIQETHMLKAVRTATDRTETDGIASRLGSDKRDSVQRDLGGTSTREAMFALTRDILATMHVQAGT